MRFASGAGGRQDVGLSRRPWMAESELYKSVFTLTPRISKNLCLIRPWGFVATEHPDRVIRVSCEQLESSGD